MAAPTAVINGILKGIGAPINANTQQAMQEWFAAEGGSNNNWLNRRTGPGGPIASYGSQAAGIAATVDVINQSNMAGIKNSLVQGLSPEQVKAAVIASPWSENHYSGTDFAGGTTNATLTSDVTTTATQPSSADTALIPQTTFAAPEKNVNLKNFHGYDLSAIPQNELGNAEQAIQKYITDPGYAQQLQQRISQDYGYQGSWAEKIPQLNAALIYAATSLDLSTAAGKNQFQSLVANTDWWKQTDANQRSWQQIQSTDPAQAHQALVEAQQKVLATANQIGVQLSKTQLNNIANQYASLNFVQSGSFGTSSGTAPEWLDQQVEQAVTAAGKTGTSDLFAQGPTATSAGSLTGISSQLYEQFQQVAQQYLMYNPNGNGLLSQKNLMDQVNQALQSYTGTGASGQISQFEAGALNNFTEQMKAQASQMYPSLAAAIAQGTTPQAYTQPQANLISNTLGIDPASIDFTSPQWNWTIATPDPKTNTKTALTQDQILQHITNPNFTFQGPNGQTMTYNNTNNAMQTAQSAVNSLGAFFGIGGT